MFGLGKYRLRVGPFENVIRCNLGAGNWRKTVFTQHSVIYGRSRPIILLSGSLFFVGCYYRGGWQLNTSPAPPLFLFKMARFSGDDRKQKNRRLPQIWLHKRIRVANDTKRIFVVGVPSSARHKSSQFSADCSIAAVRSVYRSFAPGRSSWLYCSAGTGRRGLFPTRILLLSLFLREPFLNRAITRERIYFSHRRSMLVMPLILNDNQA